MYAFIFADSISITIAGVDYRIQDRSLTTLLFALKEVINNIKTCYSSNKSVEVFQLFKRVYAFRTYAWINDCSSSESSVSSFKITDRKTVAKHEIFLTIFVTRYHSPAGANKV